ncbi:gamma carbonic anhydrase family protein [Clostridium sp. JN-1]|uniref:gamma carbonic anhydrase family protein n=1 Tax=Clostridium sp. JN-1 TaxID=2483110 RepID=UPI000F0BC193|nr:gamma carbonic anhydrase family protein [Clostridium sp. JN-1]
MIYYFKDKKPQIHKSCFIAPSADIIGDVYADEFSSFWYGSVVRGDANSIYIGKSSNVQDNCVIHSSKDNNNVVIGSNVTIGHGSIIHGCTISSNTLIGMGSVILDGAKIGSNTIIGANSMVTKNKEIPSGVMCFGSPAKVIRELTKKEYDYIMESSYEYEQMVKEFLTNPNYNK